jgi:chaperonin GroES
MSKWLQQAYESDNIAELLTDEELVKLGAEVHKGYKEDLTSRTEWEDRQEGYMKLALQVVETKSSPWTNAANIKFPLLTTATMAFGARAYPSLIPGLNIVKGKVTGYDSTGEKAKSAERVGKHMSYQLIEEMTGWEEDMDRLSVSIPIVGCMFKKTYNSNGRNVSELVFPKNLIVNYWAKNLEDAPRVTHEIQLSENKVYERIQAGLFLDQDYEKVAIREEPVKDEAHGIQAPPESESTPGLFLEQHMWYDLDGDGYKEPYIVTTCEDKVARIVAGFDLDSVILNGDKVARIDRINYFTKYGFVPSPDGSFYDVGFGVLLGPINDTINTTINQLLDAGTMSTRAGGFLGRGAKIKGGKHAFKPFEWQQLQSTGDDVRKNVVPLPVREPSGVLFSLLGMMVEAGKELSSTVPMMMGQNPGQNQPATTSIAVIEQGSKVYSAIFKRLHRALHNELKKIKRLNRLNLPPESYFTVLDVKDVAEGDEPQDGQDKIFNTDYSDDVTDVQPYSDPNLVSVAQRMMKAQQINEMMAQNLIPNPIEGARIVLESLDLPNIDKLLVPPEPQPNPEFELDKLKVESDVQYKQGDLEIKAQLADAQIVNLETQALLNLAKAEATSNEIEIKVYEAQVKEFKERREGLSQIISSSRDNDKFEMERNKIESGTVQ